MRNQPNAQGLSVDILAHRWRFESALAQIRWLTLPGYLVLIPLVPTSQPFLVIVLMLAVGLANTGSYFLLRREPSLHRLRIVAGWSTGLEWFGVLGLAILCRDDPDSKAPALFSTLILVDAIRYGHPGLVGAMLGALLGSGALVSAQTAGLRVFGLSEAERVLASWAILIVVTALLVGSLLRVGQAWLSSQEVRWAQVQAHVSPREMEILSLVAREDLTYEQIAEILSISPETVRTHVHNLGVKLGAATRSTIARAARERGLLPPGRG